MGKHTLHESEDVTTATGRHADSRTDGVAVTELLDEARREGRPVRLVWPVSEPDALVTEEMRGTSAC